MDADLKASWKEQTKFTFKEDLSFKLFSQVFLDRIEDP